MSTVFRLLLLRVCGVRRGDGAGEKAPAGGIIYMAYSIIMSVIWILQEAPDLALTEAA